jgi:hypothetical protein
VKLEGKIASEVHLIILGNILAFIFGSTLKYVLLLKLSTAYVIIILYIIYVVIRVSRLKSASFSFELSGRGAAEA